MNHFESRGRDIRSEAKRLVLDFLGSHPDGRPGGKGIRQAQIFRLCGLDWGDRPNATSGQQQFWVVALLRELEKDGLVERVARGGPWRLAGVK